MKHTLLPLIFLLLVQVLGAQTPDADTTIYQVAESLPYPLLNACNPLKHPGWTEDSARTCAENQLMQLLASNIRYPELARQNNTTGTVVASFIVEKDGHMSQIGLMKDIGDGCGTEALRVLNAISEAGLRWRPAQQNGAAVRMQKALPIKFRLEEELPYVISEYGDTIYTILDQDVAYRGGFDSLADFVVRAVNYPAGLEKTCKVGVVELALLVRPDGSSSVENQLDYNNLGLDFQFEAIRLAKKTNGMWEPAIFQDNKVTATFPLRVVFKSPDPGCATANDNFDRAILLGNEGADLSDKDDLEGAIAKWTEALELHPGNTELLYYRGSAYLSLNKREEACQDYNAVKAKLGLTWFESIRRILCGGN
ncbi:MAG: energy transducer TonB [Lewinellaceae bacterium]|nr:energy transducer TonB [Lewinellaceae bacterium]